MFKLSLSNMKFLLLLLSIIIPQLAQAQFASQAGLIGSTAIEKQSPDIVAWGDSCIVSRGWINSADTSLGKVSNGIIADARYMADNSVISLGDGGEAIYFFSNPIVNGLGYDFAIFENGFRNPSDSNLAYLELATVEVSNDGNTYYNFAAECHNDTSIQIAGTGEYMDCRKLNNLAGKYISSYGTPFEVDELSMQFGLDVNNIHFVKIIDVIGTINDSLCNRDYFGNKINDPYPTDFPTGGFDLDALGVIHQKFPTGMLDNHTITTTIYPNPTSNTLHIKSLLKVTNATIYSIDGKIIRQELDLQNNTLNIDQIIKGNYYLRLQFENGTFNQQLIVKW